MLKHHDREGLIWAAETLQPTEKLFLLALNSFVDARGECYPGLELLSRMTGLTERTCRNIRDRLREKGVIATNRRHTDKGFRTSDLYKVNFDALKNLPENTSTGKQNLPENGASLPETVSGSYRKMTTKPTGNSFQGSIQKNSPDLTIQIEQHPWVQKPHRYNPVYAPEMLEAVKRHLAKYDQPSMVGDAMRWLNGCNFQNPSGEKRTADAYAIWSEIKATPEKPVTQLKPITVTPGDYQIFEDAS